MTGRGSALRLNWSSGKGPATWEAHLYTYRLSVHARHGQAHWRVHEVGQWGDTLSGSVTDTTAEAKHAAERAVARLLGWEHL